MSCDDWFEIESGELAPMLFELWRNEVSGVATVANESGGRELLFLRRGMWILPPGPEPATRAQDHLDWLSSWGPTVIHVEVGTASHPPLRSPSVVDLGEWARRHLEAELNGNAAGFANNLGDCTVEARRAGRLPIYDEHDRELLAALERPVSLRRLHEQSRCAEDRISPFLYFLFRVGELVVTDCSVERRSARATLGVSGDDMCELREAYRTRARDLHPDLMGHVEPGRRRDLELRLAQVNRAYEVLSA